MRYLVVDGSLSGSGIRDQYEGGYLDPEELSLSTEVIERLNKWLSKYANEKYNGYSNESFIDELDREGKEIAASIKHELNDVKLQYFSDARLTKELV